MLRRILLLAILTLSMLSMEIRAQQLTPPQQRTVEQLFKKNKVVYFKFNVRSQQEIAQFGKIVSVDKMNGMQVLAHADKAQFSRFIRLNIPYTLTPKTGKTSAKPKAAPAKKK